MVQCNKCEREAILFVRYNGNHLCQQHFQDYVERRVKKEIRRQIPISRPTRVAVAISGGKDSAVALEMIYSTLGRRRDIDIIAITVDEGVSGYRPHTLEKARQQTARLGVRHEVVNFTEIAGLTLDQMVIKTPEAACSLCGVFRRRCLNLKAKELKVDVLVTGHNLDDVAQSVLMNFMRGDVERLARMGPHLRVQPGLVPRAEPLRLIPEQETMLYALVCNLEFSDDECPYASQALRNEYRELIDRMEWKHPGTKHSIVASYDALRPTLLQSFPPATLRTCRCGEPTLQEQCMACSMQEKLIRKGFSGEYDRT